MCMKWHIYPAVYILATKAYAMLSHPCIHLLCMKGLFSHMIYLQYFGQREEGHLSCWRFLTLWNFTLWFYFFYLFLGNLHFWNGMRNFSLSEIEHTSSRFMHSGQSCEDIHRGFPPCESAACCSSKTAEGKLSHSSPPPSFSFQPVSFFSLFTCRTGCKHSLVPQTSQSVSQSFSLLLALQTTGCLHFSLEKMCPLEMTLRCLRCSVALCVVEQQREFWASLVAFDWASALICIIRSS